MAGTDRLLEIAAAGKLIAGDLRQQLDTQAIPTEDRELAVALLTLGPPWSDERWPVDAGARLLPTITSDTPKGLEWWVPFGEGWEIPAGFEYAGSGPFEWALWIQVVEGVAECLAIRALTTDGRPITAEGFRRLPLGRLVHRAVMIVSRQAAEIPKRADQRWANIEEAAQARAEVSATYRRTKRSPRDRAPVDDELLMRVAAIYRANLASGAPTRAVAEELHYSRASAARLVMDARKRGEETGDTERFLPPTEPRRARG